MKLSLEEKLKKLKENVSSVGFDNLSVLFYDEFAKQLENGYSLKRHDIQYINDMYKLKFGTEEA